jgi:hypothetical protein
VRRATILSTVAAFLMTFVASPRGSSADWKPVGLATLGSGGLDDSIAVLTSQGDVWTVRRNDPHPTVITKSSIFGQPSDLAAGQITTKQNSPADAIVMVGVRYSGITPLGEVNLLWPHRKDLDSKYVVAPGSSFAGVAMDRTRHVVYVADVSKREIVTVNLDSPTLAPAFWVGTTPLFVPGSLAVDSVQRPKRLFSSAVDGSIYVISIDSRSISRLADGLGNIRGIAFDSASNRLLAVDINCRCVWQLPLDGPSGSGSKAISSLRGQLRTPLSIAWTAAGTWIADAGAGAVLLFDSAGKVSQEIRP